MNFSPEVLDTFYGGRMHGLAGLGKKGAGQAIWAASTAQAQKAYELQQRIDREGARMDAAVEKVRALLSQVQSQQLEAENLAAMSQSPTVIAASERITAAMQAIEDIAATAEAAYDKFRSLPIPDDPRQDKTKPVSAYNFNAATLPAWAALEGAFKEASDQLNAALAQVPRIQAQATAAIRNVQQVVQREQAAELAAQAREAQRLQAEQQREAQRLALEQRREQQAQALEQMRLQQEYALQSQQYGLMPGQQYVDPYAQQQYLPQQYAQPYPQQQYYYAQGQPAFQQLPTAPGYGMPQYAQTYPPQILVDTTGAEGGAFEDQSILLGADDSNISRAAQKAGSTIRDIGKDLWRSIRGRTAEALTPRDREAERLAAEEAAASQRTSGLAKGAVVGLGLLAGGYGLYKLMGKR